MPFDYVPLMPAQRRPLIVRLRNWVGDVTLGVPLLQRLADEGYELHLVGKGWARDLLAGATGPVRDAVLLNSAGAVAAFDGVPDGATVAEAIAARLPKVAEAIDSGAGAALLERWVALSREIAGV